MNLKIDLKNIDWKAVKATVKGTDLLLLALTLALSLFGTIMVSSATFDAETGALFSRDSKVMIFAAILGVTAALIISAIDYDIILKLWPVVGAGSVFLMLMLFPFGVSPDARSDAFSWFRIGSLYFQPSEIVKIGFIITFAFHLSKVKNNISDIKHVFLLCMHAAIPILLVVATGDMGSALIFMCMFIGMMFAAGLNWMYFPAGALIVLVASPVIWFKIFDDIQRNRILALFRPEEYTNEIYQQNQALAAIKEGGLFGMGLFNGKYTQTPNAIPEVENDMIFSAVCEETGFFGALLLMGLFICLAVKIVHVGKRSKNFAALMMCYGVMFMIIAQAAINIGMCTRLLPVIGITLPFISAGGSSTVCLFLAMGLILSIYRSSKELRYEDYRFSRMTK